MKKTNCFIDFPPLFDKNDIEPNLLTPLLDIYTNKHSTNKHSTNKHTNNSNNNLTDNSYSNYLYTSIWGSSTSPYISCEHTPLLSYYDQKYDPWFHDFMNFKNDSLTNIFQNIMYMDNNSESDHSPIVEPFSQYLPVFDINDYDDFPSLTNGTYNFEDPNYFDNFTIDAEFNDDNFIPDVHVENNDESGNNATTNNLFNDGLTNWEEDMEKFFNKLEVPSKSKQESRFTCQKCGSNELSKNKYEKICMVCQYKSHIQANKNKNNWTDFSAKILEQKKKQAKEEAEKLANKKKRNRNRKRKRNRKRNRKRKSSKLQSKEIVIDPTQSQRRKTRLVELV